MTSSFEAYDFFVICTALTDLDETRNDVIAQDVRVSCLAEMFELDYRNVADDVLHHRLLVNQIINARISKGM